MAQPAYFSRHRAEAEAVVLRSCPERVTLWDYVVAALSVARRMAPRDLPALDVDDLAQEALVRMLESHQRDTASDPANFSQCCQLAKWHLTEFYTRWLHPCRYPEHRPRTLTPADPTTSPCLAIEHPRAGEPFIHVDIADLLDAFGDRLTEGRRRVLLVLRTGKVGRAAAEALGISPRTLEAHVRAIKTEARAWARRGGIDGPIVQGPLIDASRIEHAEAFRAKALERYRGRKPLETRS